MHFHAPLRDFARESDSVAARHLFSFVLADSHRRLPHFREPMSVVHGQSGEVTATREIKGSAHGDEKKVIASVP
jgi:hypothetical protein